jgi:trk system potassium uptake protein TrkA
VASGKSSARTFWERFTSAAPVDPATTAAAPDVESNGLSARAPGHANEFVVIGLGRFGTSVARTLVRHGFTVLAIDRSLTRVQELSTVLPHVVQLDATNIEALRQAGVDGFEVGVVCIGEDFESNLLATVILLKLGLKRVIAKARTNTQKEILQRIGAHEVILPEHEAGMRLARRLASGSFIDYLEVSGEVGVVELVAPDSVLGQSLIEADIRNKFGLTVVAVQRGAELIVSPAPDFVINRGDVLVVMGNIDAAEQFSE